MNNGLKAKELVRLLSEKLTAEVVQVKLANIAKDDGSPLFSFSTAYQLARGTYGPTPKQAFTDAIFKLAEEYGVSLTDEGAA
jgi:hypothetical protein